MDGDGAPQRWLLCRFLAAVLGGILRCLSVDVLVPVRLVVMAVACMGCGTLRPCIVGLVACPCAALLML